MELMNVYILNDYIHSLISFNQKIIFQSTENIWLSQYVNKIIRLHSHKSTKLCQDQILLNILGFILTRAVGVSIGRPSGGRLATTLVAPINVIFFNFFSQFFFLRRDLSSQKECSDQKTYLAKVAQNAQKPRGRQIPSAILGPPGGHFVFLRFSQKE